MPRGTLAQARVIHFATHGLIASETETITKSLAEPALLLTPPDVATETDDGLLTASEVTELKLDADWVVLSACNTAAGGEKGDAEALSGLARAFFYAGAHSLLVSHWQIDSEAAVKLTTGAFAELKRDPTIGRAEALRRAMLAAMADTSRPATWTASAHPSVWAPFTLVGEGATIMAAVPVAAPIAAPSSATTGAIPATPVEANSKAGDAPAPNAEVVAPAAPETDAVSGATTLLAPNAPPLPDDNQRAKTGATKKARSKSKPDDWITSIFGQ